jgi:hypothetical protein
VADHQFGAGGVLSALLVREDPPAPGHVQGVGLPVEVLLAGRDPGIADADLAPKGASASSMSN